LLRTNNMSLLQLHDRRVVVELDEFCKGSSLRANSDLANVWRLKDGVLNYVNYMHKIWPLEPGPQIIYRVLDDSRWAAVAGDDKKLRANMIRQFFNEAVEVNAGKAVVRAMCLTHQEAKARWVQLVEREFPHTSAMAIGARNGGGGGAARNNGGANKKAGRGAAQPQGSAGGSTGQGTGGGSGGGGGSRPGGSVFSTPIPRFNGMSVCWNYNKGGCTRPAHSTTACKDPNTSSIFAHVCNFWDPAAKQHCYGTHSRSEPGRH
jgi:hypothetical protein